MPTRPGRWQLTACAPGEYSQGPICESLAMFPSVTPTADARPVCVLGMHRSGTSLAASIVGAMGIDLGSAETMLPVVGQENLRGYYEQTAIRDLNDDLLETLGGSWWKPPELRAGWEEDPALAPLYDRAEELFRTTFDSGARPGFKDPRLSLTLPFWRRVTGPIDCVVCTRAADAVAASLRRRFSTGPQWVPPWYAVRRHDWQGLAALYLDSAMAASAEERRVVVAYDDWFPDPSAQLERVAELLGGVSAEALEHARQMVAPELRHHVAAALT